MCGIAGTLVFEGDTKPVNAELLTRMRDTMTHRGPDGGGFWIHPEGFLGLAHRRLSIIDLSDLASQPMSNVGETLHIVFNGEIYNHAEIRHELEKRGHNRWKTDHSDTEVILHAFEEWGIECLHRFRGMFAFALWDDRDRSLWLVRDRIGIKPLYYSQHHQHLNFASEIKSLLADPEQSRDVNEEALYHYLTFMTTPAPTTLFNGIFKMAPGTWMHVRRDGRIRSERYWDVLEHTRPVGKVADEEIAAQVLDELKVAVALRKVSDVPVGVFLSGGIDSSTNAALFSEGGRDRVRTFSIGYKGEYQSYQNELHYARRVAEFVSAEHHELLLDVDDLLQFLPQMIHLQDEPIGDPVCVPVYYVSKLARDNGVVVCQVGEGADELFWGYPSWKTRLRAEEWGRVRPGGPVKRAMMWGLERTGRSGSVMYEALRRSVAGLRVFWGSADQFSLNEKSALLSPRLREKFRNLTSWDAVQPIYDRFMANAWEPSSLHWMSYLDLNMRLPELLLMRVDKMSMGTSLEARVPFLDHKFVELAMSIPQKAKTRGGRLKHILKMAVRDTIPYDVIHRPKQGFGVPLLEWYFGRLGDRVRSELLDFTRRTDLFDPSYVEQMLNMGDSDKLWILLNFVLWHRHFIEKTHSSLLEPSVTPQ